MGTLHRRSSAIVVAIWMGLLVGMLGASVTARTGPTFRDAFAFVLLSSFVMMALLRLFNRTRLWKTAAIVRAADRTGRRP